MGIVWLIVVIALSTFAVETAFVYVSIAKKILRLYKIPLDLKCIAYFWLIVGYPADIVFNWTRGTIMFLEFPRELLFTSRIQRLIYDKGWRGEKAQEWAEIMNEVDPGHV